MTRYTIFRETAEISEKAYKKYDGDIISALFEKDRDGGDPIKTFETKEEALEALKNYRCSGYRASGFAGVYFYACEFYYVEEEEYDEEYEEWEISDDFTEYAEIAS